jgi:hypothetical protein
VSIYADDSNIYSSANTANEVTVTFNKELQFVLEWVASNKLIPNISKTVFGTNHSLSSRPQMNLVMNGVSVEQVEETKLLGITLECKWSWSKHIDSVAVKMGERSVRNKEMLCFSDTTLHKVLQALVLSYPVYCPDIWSSAANKDLVKLELAHNRETQLALHCNQRANINTMQASMSWLRIEERMTASLLVFTRKMNVSEIPNGLHSQLTHTLTPGSEQIQGNIYYYTEP